MIKKVVKVVKRVVKQPGIVWSLVVVSRGMRTARASTLTWQDAAECLLDSAQLNRSEICEVLGPAVVDRDVAEPGRSPASSVHGLNVDEGEVQTT